MANATYSYLANSMLVSQIVYKQNSTTRMTTTKSYDFLNRLTGIASAPAAAGQPPLSYLYAYNNANQRTQVNMFDGSYWKYTYDTLGQVTSGNKYWAERKPVPGEQFDYAFDTIGNRTSTLAGGDISGGSLRSATYTANNLNQYSSRTVPNGLDVLGLANVSATVEVNGSTPDYRRGEFFHELLNVTNSGGAVWDSVMVGVTNGASGSNVVGNVFVPPATENFAYDADGNLTSDGRWNYTWDGENRLISMTSLSGAPTNSQLELYFQYDWQGRRIQKSVLTNNNGAGYSASYTNVFAYDGWNMVATLNPSLSFQNSYVWGSDLSGSQQGAGGVGGLLVSKQAGGNPLLPAFDGNGNLMGLVDATSGTNYCAYEYGPFGEPIRLTPNSGNPCPFQFSTKFTDTESGLVYYGERYLTQRGNWLSRDPVSESGFNLLSGNEAAVGVAGPDDNVYALAGDNPVNQIDPFGLAFYAIDGTWAKASDITNPWKLFHWTKETPAWYFRGPRDGLFGLDTGLITVKVWKRVCTDYCAAGGNNFTVNLTGWSRGAVAAVGVAQLLNDRGCDCGCGRQKPIPVNWIGLFDAVKQTAVVLPKSLPPNVAHFYHAVKTSTAQWYFPTLHYSGGTEYPVYNYRPPTLSSHSDVGTSDTATEQHINGAYNWIQNSAIESGVKF